MITIYVLRCECNKYYIGKTTNPEFRLNDHFNATGSAWTQKYKPIQVLQLIPNCDDFDEDKYTLKYMSEYGINNVRGGSFCQVRLSEDNVKVIRRMIHGSTDKCFICGKKGHFANECKNDINGINIIVNGLNKLVNSIFGESLQLNYSYDSFDSSDSSDSSYDYEDSNYKCTRCGRFGHLQSKCYARTHIRGYKLYKTEYVNSNRR